MKNTRSKKRILAVLMALMLVLGTVSGAFAQEMSGYTQRSIGGQTVYVDASGNLYVLSNGKLVPFEEQLGGRSPGRSGGGQQTNAGQRGESPNAGDASGAVRQNLSPILPAQNSAPSAGNAGGADNTGNAGGADNTGNAGGTDNTGNAGGTDNTGNAGGTDNTGNAGGTDNTGNAGGTDNTGNAGGTDNTGNAGGTDNTGNAGGTDNTGNADGADNTGGNAGDTDNTGGAREPVSVKLQLNAYGQALAVGVPISLGTALTVSNGTPTGSVSFMDNNVVIASGVSISDGSASVSWTPATAGEHVLTVQYFPGSDDGYKAGAVSRSVQIQASADAGTNIGNSVIAENTPAPAGGNALTPESGGPAVIPPDSPENGEEQSDEYLLDTLLKAVGDRMDARRRDQGAGTGDAGVSGTAAQAQSTSPDTLRLSVSAPASVENNAAFTITATAIPPENGVAPTGTVFLSGTGFTAANVSAELVNGGATFSAVMAAGEGDASIIVNYQNGNYMNASASASVQVAGAAGGTLANPPSDNGAENNNAGDNAGNPADAGKGVSAAVALGLTVSAPATAEKDGEFAITVVAQTPENGAAPAGTVTLYGDGFAAVDRNTAPLVNNTATFAVKALAEGSVTITAQYAGDDYPEGASGSATVQIGSAAKGGTAPEAESAAKLGLTVSVSPATAKAGDKITVTVSGAVSGGGTAPQGTVSIAGDALAGYAANVPLVGEPLTAAFTATVADTAVAGSQTVTATYAGADYAATASAALTIGEGEAPAAANAMGMTIALDSGNVTVGDSVTATVSLTLAGGGKPTGNVSIEGLGSAVLTGGSAAEGKLVYEGTADKAGEQTVTARYLAGSEDPYANGSATASLMIGEAKAQAGTEAALAMVQMAAAPFALPSLNMTISVGNTVPAAGQPMTVTIFVPAGITPLGTVTLSSWPNLSVLPATKNFTGNAVTFNVTIPPATTDFTLTAVYNGSTDYAQTTKTLTLKAGNMMLTQANTQITLSSNPAAYNGQPKTTQVTSVICGGVPLTLNDYTVSPTPLTFGPAPGDYTVTITGKGSYSGSATAIFQITGIDLSNAVIATPIANQPYTGSPITPMPLVTLNGVQLLADRDFTYRYANNTAVGNNTASIQVVGINSYSGVSTQVATFSIVQNAMAPTVTIMTTVGYLNANTDIKASVKIGNSNVNEGTVTFTIDGVQQMPVNVVGGVATLFGYRFTTSGQHTVSAAYTGTPGIPSSVRVDGVITVGNTLPTTPTFTAVASGTRATLTFTVPQLLGGPVPTGTVTFTQPTGSFSRTVQLVNGVAVLTIDNLIAGRDYTFNAVYSGDKNYPPAGPLTAITNSGKFAPTVLLTVRGGENGEPAKMTVSAFGLLGSPIPSGNVEIRTGNSTITRLKLDVHGEASYVWYDTPWTQYSLTAHYEGDSLFAPTTSNIVTLNSGHQDKYNAGVKLEAKMASNNRNATLKAVMTTNWWNYEYGRYDFNDAGYGWNARNNVFWGPTGWISFYRGNTLLGTVQLVNGEATMTWKDVPTGTHTITAVYSGDANFFTNRASVYLTRKSSSSGGGSSSSGASTTKPATTSSMTGNIKLRDAGNNVLETYDSAKLPLVDGTMTVQTAREIDFYSFGFPISQLRQNATLGGYFNLVAPGFNVYVPFDLATGIEGLSDFIAANKLADNQIEVRVSIRRLDASVISLASAGLDSASMSSFYRVDVTLHNATGAKYDFTPGEFASPLQLLIPHMAQADTALYYDEVSRSFLPVGLSYTTNAAVVTVNQNGIYVVVQESTKG